MSLNVSRLGSGRVDSGLRALLLSNAHVAKDGHGTISTINGFNIGNGTYGIRNAIGIAHNGGIATFNV